MKKLKAALGITLALVMLFSAVQVSTVSVSAKTPEDNPSSGYDMTIDFNYKDKYSSPEQAMAGYTDEQFEPMSALYSNYKAKQYRWVQIQDNVLSYKKNGDALRKALEEDADGTGYVMLKNDQKLTLTKQVWQPIEITRDTVLDLNGYALELHDNYNVKGTKQRADESSHSSYMFDISNRATLTIIDSSAIRGEGDDNKGTGSVFIDGRMIDPYKNKYDWYTHRDIFHVNDGNLVIYGGSYQAGRSKVEKKKNFSWDKLKTAIGSAVTLGLAIYEYSTGIGEAEAALKDVQAGFDTALKAVEEGKADDDDPKSSAGGAKDLTTENQKKGNDDEVAKEQKVNIPTKDVKAPASKTDEKDSKGRNETVDEKSKRRDDENEKDGKAKEGENKANSDQASKNDKNTKIYQAEKAVGNAALNPDKIGEMVNSAFDLTDAVVGMFGSKGAIVETVWGTCVKVGSQGTFVSYGGNYIGYGSSPYERNAVVEVARPKNSTKGGKAYIYDGTFEGKAGANTFNLVRTRSFNWKDTPNGKTSGNKDIDFLSRSFFKDENGKTKEYVYETGICNDDGLADSENYMKTLEEDENGNPYDTSCIQVRGGTFRNYYEHLNVGARLRTAGTDENFEAYAGTSGTVHLGIGSFNENFIRDGRIQIIDTYGDGALVLMDAKDKADENVYHYRLYCGDTELRCKRYLRVYPTQAESNSSHSFKLTTQYRNQNTHSTGSAAQGLITTDKNGNVVTEVMENEDKLDDVENSGAFSQREMFFYYPIGISNSHNYYVVPNLNDGTDVKGERLGASSAWYYNTPTDYYGHPIDSFVFRDEVIYSTISDTISGSKRENEKSFEEYKQKIADGVFTGPSYTYGMHSYNYLSNFKWFKYRVYRVDPLTRENISESDTYGEDKPLKEAVYGASTDSLRCKLPLDELGINYKPGEIYRIVFDVDEYVGYDYNDTLHKHTSNLDTAKLECSMLFMCYDGKEEITDKGNNYFDEDYTPLQWDKAPEGGKTASVRLVNGKTGQVDCNGDNIFDVYYQWYQVEDDGTEKMIAGTDNIFTGDIINGKANPDKWATKDHHLIQHFKAKGTYYNSAYINDSESDGYTYVNTVKPGTDTTGFLDTGLPRDRAKWTEQMLHMYTQEDRTKSDYTKDGSSKLYLANNKPFQYNTDSCYIPESAKGKRIYCKVICVNTFWQKNYAHVQVFRTHTERVSKDIEAKVSLSIDGESNYISKDGTRSMIAKSSRM